MCPSEQDGRPADASQIARAAASVIAERLPSGWSVVPHDRPGDFSVADGDGVSVGLRVVVSMQERGSAMAELVARADEAGRAGFVPVVSTPYLTGPARERLRSAKVGHVDATGNVWLRLDRPALFLSDRGADADPWRGKGRPAANLKGRPAASIVRALIDCDGPWTALGLAKTAGVAVGSVYRVADVAGREGFLRRDGRNGFAVTDWPGLLRAWSHEYGFVSSNKVTSWIAPRGLDDLVTAMSQGDYQPYALSGSTAATNWAERAPVRLAMVYAADPDQAAATWGLRLSEAGANVLIAEPAYTVALDRRVEGELGQWLAAPAQVAVDLMTGPGRSPAEAEELIRWMEDHEPDWRRPQS
ncbi:MAG: hypothetical protein LBS56_00650 [Propionibacteriaceae bacterium]|nr:hypothetical protein [Propionibacteriaceae bacterium]